MVAIDAMPITLVTATSGQFLILDPSLPFTFGFLHQYVDANFIASSDLAVYHRTPTEVERLQGWN